MIFSFLVAYHGRLEDRCYKSFRATMNLGIEGITDHRKKETTGQRLIVSKCPQPEENSLGTALIRETFECACRPTSHEALKQLH